MLLHQQAFPRVRGIEAAGREVALRRKGLVPRTLRAIAGTEPRATGMDGQVLRDGRMDGRVFVDNAG
jgi:hypothetical protein